MSNEPKAKNSKYHVPALEKGLDILEALALASTPQSLTDLARTLNRSSSELFRMLNCLENRHYVIREDNSGNYRLSLKLYTLAHNHSPIEELVRAASQPMQELAERVRESCHLGTLSHNKLVILAQAESPRRVQLSVKVGWEFSPIYTVSGRLLLAHLSPDEQVNLLTDDDDYQELTDSKKEELKVTLAQLRQQGYAIVQDESHLGIKDIAVLVGNPEIGLIAALTIPSLKAIDRPDNTEQLLTALQSCAKKINKEIGVM